MGCEINKPGESELVSLSPGTRGVRGKGMEQTPEQERRAWACVLDVPDVALPSRSLGTDLAASM